MARHTISSINKKTHAKGIEMILPLQVSLSRKVSVIKVIFLSYILLVPIVSVLSKTLSFSKALFCTINL